MKWNWGKGLVVGMLAFMSFILYLVITMSTDKKYSHDLVTEEYYAKEMAYQKEIDAEENVLSLSNKITGERTPEGWLLTFPKELQKPSHSGEVFLYRPSNKQLDFQFPLELSGQNLLIPDNKLIDGRWNITIDFQHEGKNFLYKEAISY